MNIKNKTEEEFNHFCKFRCPYKNELTLAVDDKTINVDIDLGQFGDYTIDVDLNEHIEDGCEVCNVCSAKEFYEQLLIELEE